jgi:hypothetical protein
VRPAQRNSAARRAFRFFSKGATVTVIGKTIWAIAEGYIPSQSTSTQHDLISHEAACILNASDQTAEIDITIYFADRDCVGPYHVSVEPRRTLHLRFNDLQTPTPIPRDTAYSSVFVSSAPIVVQHTRLDSRKAELALLSTMAFGQ